MAKIFSIDIPGTRWTHAMGLVAGPHLEGIIVVFACGGRGFLWTSQSGFTFRDYR